MKRQYKCMAHRRRPGYGAKLALIAAAVGSWRLLGMMAAGGVTKKTACVTGGNGFVGSALVKLLLQRGYRVHATVRNPAATTKLAHLRALKSLGKLKLFAADLLVDGSFDEAVAACDYVFHVASPEMFNQLDPENNTIKPAVEGMLNVLKSCTKAEVVRRVVLTSSVAAVSANRLEGTGLVVDEMDWTDVDYLIKEKPPVWGYLVAKTLAEKAAWKYTEEHKLDLVVINPVLVVGPTLTPHLSHSTRTALSLVTGEEQLLLGLKIMQKIAGSISLVHVEDVCQAQVHVAEAESASGRYILSAVNSGIHELAAFLSKKYPQYKIASNNLGDVPPIAKLRVSSEKIIKEGFKFKYEKLEDIYDEIIEYGKVMGLQPKMKEVVM